MEQEQRERVTQRGEEWNATAGTPWEKSERERAFGLGCVSDLRPTTCDRSLPCPRQLHLGGRFVGGHLSLPPPATRVTPARGSKTRHPPLPAGSAGFHPPNSRHLTLMLTNQTQTYKQRNRQNYQPDTGRWNSDTKGAGAGAGIP